MAKKPDQGQSGQAKTRNEAKAAKKAAAPKTEAVKKVQERRAQNKDKQSHLG